MKSNGIINFMIILALNCTKWFKCGQILIFKPKFPCQILTLFIWKWFSIEHTGSAEFSLLMSWFDQFIFKKLYFLNKGPIFVASCATENKCNEKIICWYQLFRQTWAFSRLRVTCSTSVVILQAPPDTAGFTIPALKRT